MFAADPNASDQLSDSEWLSPLLRWMPPSLRIRSPSRRTLAPALRASGGVTIVG